jgi:hypothetical protein
MQMRRCNFEACHFMFDEAASLVNWTGNESVCQVKYIEIFYFK